MTRRLGKQIVKTIAKKPRENKDLRNAEALLVASQSWTDDQKTYRAGNTCPKGLLGIALLSLVQHILLIRLGTSPKSTVQCFCFLLSMAYIHVIDAFATVKQIYTFHLLSSLLVGWHNATDIIAMVPLRTLYNMRF